MPNTEHPGLHLHFQLTRDGMYRYSSCLWRAVDDAINRRLTWIAVRTPKMHFMTRLRDELHATLYRLVKCVPRVVHYDRDSAITNSQWGWPSGDYGLRQQSTVASSTFDELHATTLYRSLYRSIDIIGYNITIMSLYISSSSISHSRGRRPPFPLWKV